VNHELPLTELTAEVEYAHRFCHQAFGAVRPFTIKEVAADFAMYASRSKPLSSGERGVLSILKPKTAALFADRVWIQYSGEDPRLDFAFGWESRMSIRLAALFAFIPRESFTDTDAANEGLNERGRKFLSWTEAELAGDYAVRTGALITPMYNSSRQRDADYEPGNLAVITSVVENVAVVSEEHLTWEQVLEFRGDQVAQAAYRRFVHWLDDEMVGRPEAFVCESVAARLERYEWALRKHGIQTVVGALERTVSASSVVGSVAAGAAIQYLAQQPLLSLLAGAGLLVANAAIYATTALITREDILVQNNDVAFVHHVRRKLGAPKAA